MSLNEEMGDETIREEEDVESSKDRELEEALGENAKKNKEDLEAVPEYAPIPEPMTRAAKRAQKLAQEASALRSENEQLQLAIRERDEALSLRERELQESRQRDSNNLMETLEREEDLITQDLILAKDRGDIEREVELHKALTRVSENKIKAERLIQESSYQERYSDDSYNNYYEPQNDYSDDYDQNQSYEYEELPLNDHIVESPEATRFFANNPFLDEGSSSFNPEIRKYADIVDENLAQRYKEKGIGHLIGTDGYFNSLHNIVHQSLKERNLSSSSSMDTRSGGSMAETYAARNNYSPKINLTEQEINLARNLRTDLPLKQRLEMYQQFKEEERGREYE